MPLQLARQTVTMLRDSDEKEAEEGSEDKDPSWNEGGMLSTLFPHFSLSIPIGISIVLVSLSFLILFLLMAYYFNLVGSI